MRVRVTRVVALVLLLAAGCGEGTTTVSTGGTTSTTRSSGSTTSTTDGGTTLAGYDPALTRRDVDCSHDFLAGPDDLRFPVAHFVVDGRLGAICLGEEEDALLDAWSLLATITPRGQLSDLGLFAGFDSSGDGGEYFAFVVDLDLDGEAFLMAVNLDEAEFDRDELALTLAHEFSHVFTALPSELDRDIDADDCPTYHNGDGCYTAGSLMSEWIELFWSDLIAEVDPSEEASFEIGEQRCATEAGFFGPYAAAGPEEDFAESFSAFVFQVQPFDDEVLRRKMDWLAGQPGLREFRDRAEAAGLRVDFGANFEQCGLG